MNHALQHAQQAPEPASAIHSAIRVGCAGWSLPRAAWTEFATEGSHLERYAVRFNAVEINSSFYRPHQCATYARWAESVPADFRFAVKIPKAITHTQRLQEFESLLDTFLLQAGGLGVKLGCLLVQLPPSLALQPSSANDFFRQLRDRHAGDVALEPRHASWFTEAGDALLLQHRIARVLADPVLFDAGRAPGGFTGLTYVRLHGSPRMYYSAYPSAVLDALIERLRIEAFAGKRVWCVFDNTAGGEASFDALCVVGGLRRSFASVSAGMAL